MLINWFRFKGGWLGKFIWVLNDRGDDMKVLVSILRVLNKRVGWLEMEYEIFILVGYGILYVIVSKWFI